MLQRIESITLRIIGWRLLVLLTVSTALYSMASAYVGGTLASTLDFLREEPPAPHGEAMLSVYSGTATTPVTGLLPARMLASLGNITGVVYAWGETTTPALLNNTLVVVRGLPDTAMKHLGLRVVAGGAPNPGDYTGILVGRGLASQLHLKPGDTVLIDSFFSTSQAIYRVEGIIEGPPPYKYEVITSPAIAESLRGTHGYSVIRIIYNPTRVDAVQLARALHVREPSRFEKLLLQQAIVLISKGAIRLENPERLQSYYIERLGIPSAYVVASGLASDLFLLSLTYYLGKVLVGLRRDPLAVLYEEGVPPGRLTIALLLVTLPFILLGGAAGLLLAWQLPAPTLLGYPIRPSQTPLFATMHLGVILGLYTIAIATAKVRG